MYLLLLEHWCLANDFYEDLNKELKIIIVKNLFLIQIHLIFTYTFFEQHVSTFLSRIM